MIGNLKRYGDASCLEFMDIYFGSETVESVEVNASCSIIKNIQDMELEETVEVATEIQ